MINNYPIAKFTLSERQNETLQLLKSSDVEEVLYGGAKGGGKSVLGCIWCYLSAKQIILDFQLFPRKYPLVVGFMGRKHSVDFNATTLNTWKRFIPEEAYEIREIDKVKHIIIEGTVAIQYGGLDSSKIVNKFNSAEFAFYFIDQAEETTEKDIGLLRGTRRLKIHNRSLNYKGLLTANPAICFLKDAFIDNPQRGNKFVQALPSDNPFLPSEYVEQLKKAFAFKPELLRAYLYGSWDDLDTANVVIPIRHVKLNVNNMQHDLSIIKRITVSDISGEGDDESVIYDMVNTRVERQEIYKHAALMDTTGRIIAHAKRNNSNLIALDVIGIGAGVFSRLQEIFEGDKNMIIYPFDSRLKGKEIIDGVTFGNKRAEAWWHAAHLFAEQRCDIPNDPVLIKQLAGVTWKYKSNGKIYMELKEKIREVIGCSPDRADTYIMGLDALEQAEPVKKVDKYMREAEDSEYALNPDTC